MWHLVALSNNNMDIGQQDWAVVLGLTMNTLGIVLDIFYCSLSNLVYLMFLSHNYNSHILYNCFFDNSFSHILINISLVDILNTETSKYKNTFITINAKLVLNNFKKCILRILHN